MATKLGLINNALILIGDMPLDSLSGNSRAHKVALNLYDNIVQNELTKYRWGFARKKDELIEAQSAPEGTQYKYQYVLPSDFLVLVKTNPRVDYLLYRSTSSGGSGSFTGQHLLTNHTGELFCDYIANIPEADFPVYFSKMIEYRLAMDFAPSIRDSAASMQLMAEQYQNASRMARYTDSQQHPITPIQDRPFIDVRY